MWFLWTIIIIFGVALIFGLGLGFASKYLRVEEDTRIKEVVELLPGYNCGLCGTAGCHDFAEGIINGEIKQLSRCKPGKAVQHFNPIIAYLNDHPNKDGSTIEVKI